MIRHALSLYALHLKSCAAAARERPAQRPRATPRAKHWLERSPVAHRFTAVAYRLTTAAAAR